jgi:hypothetical protein
MIVAIICSYLVISGLIIAGGILLTAYFWLERILT